MLLPSTLTGVTHRLLSSSRCEPAGGGELFCVCAGGSDVDHGLPYRTIPSPVDASGKRSIRFPPIRILIPLMPPPKR